jgi:hypothetical protein
MTPRITVAIPFVRVDAKQNPNIKSKSTDSSLAYFRSMTVAFASVRRLHPDIDLTLITDAAPPGEFKSILSELGIRTQIALFDHRPPAGFTRVFEGSLFLLDALNHLDADISILIDPDVLLVRPLNEMLNELGDRAGAVRIDYTVEQNINGLSRTEAMELYRLLGEPVTAPQQHMGGEFYVIPRKHLDTLRSRVDSAWTLSLHRFSQGETRFTTEEHVLNAALRGIPFMTLNNYVRRVWTAHSFRNVTKNDVQLTAWHLPAEKDRGFAALYPLVLDRSSWFWTATDDEFVSQTAKAMGLGRRTPARLALDLVAHAARKLRELDVPVADRAAG